jgi:hypothetical protein
MIIKFSKSICWVIVLLLLGTGCESKLATSVTSTASSPQTTSKGDLSADAMASLGSLEKLDDYPFYVMHYSGDYDYPHITSLEVSQPGLGCSLFVSLGELGDKLYGRNFDWEYSPSLIVFTDPSDGYASASMVDLSFIGVSLEEANELIEKPSVGRQALLEAPSMPFDGMNEYGLSVGMAAIPEEYLDDASYNPARPDIGSIGIMRLVLDHARNVDEALNLFSQYNIHFSGGPPIHYLLADRSGKAVLIEFYKGELVPLFNDAPWHLATNHLRCIAQGDGGCWRYRTLSSHLSIAQGILSEPNAMQLLSEVKQEGTQWSAVYNMSSGDIQVVIGQNYTQSYAFHLELHTP